VNGFKQSFKTTEAVVAKSMNGWVTSYELAKSEGFTHEDPVFQQMLALMNSRDASEWGDEGHEKLYKQLGLRGYFYDKNCMDVKTHEERGEEDLSATAAGPLAKKGKWNIMDQTELPDAIKVIVITPHQKLMKQLVVVCQSGLTSLEALAAELKQIKGKLRAHPGEHDSRLDSISVGIKLMTGLEEDVLQCVAVSDAITDEDQAEKHIPSLEKHKNELVSCEDTMKEIIQKSRSYLSSL
jgi:hypothetical protein